MRNERVLDLATTLETDNPQRLWGVSPASTYAALDATVTGGSLDQALGRYNRLELASTNQERDQDAVLEFHRHLLRELGLVDDGNPTEVGAFVLRSDGPIELLQTLLITHSNATRRLLRDCLAIDDLVPRREYEALLRDGHEETVLTPLLGSFNLLRVFPDGVEVSVDAVRRGLDGYDSTTEETARSTLYRRVLTSLLGDDTTIAREITATYLGRGGDKGLSGWAIVGTLAGTPVNNFDHSGVREAVDNLRSEYEQSSKQVAELLSQSGGTLTVDKSQPLTIEELQTHIELDTATPLTGLLATVAEHELFRLDANYAASRLEASVYDCFTILKSIPKVECELRDDVLVFDRVPSVDGNSDYDRYVRFLLDRHAMFTDRVEQLTDLDFAIEGAKVEATLTERLDEVEEKQLAPTYFTYTLLNPESLGKETMEAYVGDSRGLSKERARLRRWQESHPSSLHSYTAMTDRLFSLGLEAELDHRVLRIMTPFDDDTFSEYAAQLRRLLEAGHELRLLTRHTKEPWEWRRLQDNLLRRLESNRDQVSIRTYSRFKEHQRVTPSTDLTDLSEIGIHGKLHIIGAPHEGAALLGSANFMENSYHWNPECGMYTERTSFVRSATEFFDIVWDLAEADQLSFDRLQEVPNRRLIPSYYTP